MPTATAAPERYMQGIAVPASAVNPMEFFRRTRRKLGVEGARAYAGLGQTDFLELKKTDIVSGVFVRFDGNLLVAPGTGAVATTARWPYDLIKQLRFTANGQTNIINCSGLKLKAREFMAKGDLNDRGIVQSVGGANVNQGTFAQACESWGVGSRATAIPGGNYDIDLVWFVPIAEDQVDLAGAIFAASSSTDLTLTIDWATDSDLFIKTGTAAATLTGAVQFEVLRYSVPLADGQIVIPDLSTFHSLIQGRETDFALGENEKRMKGQGAGKTLLRVFSQLWNGAGTGAPLPLNEDNFGRMAWRFGGNETPDEFPDGQMLRYINERMYGVDIGGVHGFWAHEFASENAFRDTVDLATTSEWRQLVTIQNNVALTNPALEVVVESIFSAGAGS